MTDIAKPHRDLSLAEVNAPLAAVKAIADSTQDKLNDMLAACKTRQERAEILDRFSAARLNYDDCINQAFQQNDQELAGLVVKANQSAVEIEAIDKQLGNITKVITTLTTAVSYGSAIVKKIVAL